MNDVAMLVANQDKKKSKNVTAGPKEKWELLY